MLVFCIAAPENADLADEACRAAGILLYKEVGKRIGLAQTVRTRNLSGYAMFLFDIAAIEDGEAELHSAVYSLRLMYPQIRIIALELRDGREEQLERLREAGVENIAQNPEDLPVALSTEGMKGGIIRRRTTTESVAESPSDRERALIPTPSLAPARKTEPPVAEDTPPDPDVIIPPAPEFRDTGISPTGHAPPTSASPALPVPRDSTGPPSPEQKHRKRPFVLRDKKRKGTVRATDPAPARESVPTPESIPELMPVHTSVPAPSSPSDRESLTGIRLPSLGLRHPPKRAKPFAIGVCGIMRRMGATTHALGIAAYLAAQGEAACCVEVNDHGHFARFSQYHDMARTEDGAEVFGGIPIAFPDVPVPETARFLVYDFGLLDDHREAFEQCDIRVLCVGSKPWELSWLGRLFQSRTDFITRAHFIFGFTGEEEYAKMLAIMGRLAARTHFAAYAPDFTDGTANDPIYESILATRKRYTHSKGDGTP